MGPFKAFVDVLTAICKWFSCIAAALMVLIIAAVVAGRFIGQPISADVELIQFAMGVLVMTGLAFTEKANGHVTVGLIVDHMPASWQALLDMIAVILTFLVCAVVGWVNLTTAWEFVTRYTRTSDYLSIPYWPFKIVVGVGFWLWGLQALAKLPDIVSRARHGICSTTSEGHA